MHVYSSPSCQSSFRVSQGFIEARDPSPNLSIPTDDQSISANLYPQCHAYDESLDRTYFRRFHVVLKARAMYAGSAEENATSRESGPPSVSDALRYLDEVKVQYRDIPAVYNQFLDIIRDFKTKS